MFCSYFTWCFVYLGYFVVVYKFGFFFSVSVNIDIENG